MTSNFVIKRIPLRSVIGLIFCSTVLSVAGCKQQAAAPPPVASPYRLTASIQDVMLSVIDPAANGLWQSVGSTVDATGSNDPQPRSEQDWQTVRHQALALMEATNLLVMPGRTVAEAGKAIKDADLPGIQSAAKIQAAIDADRPAFIAHAHGLHDAGMEALKAIDAKDVEALEKAGGSIDEACEQCHLKYWYPPESSASSAAAKP